MSMQLRLIHNRKWHSNSKCISSWSKHDKTSLD